MGAGRLSVDIRSSAPADKDKLSSRSGSATSSGGVPTPPTGVIASSLGGFPPGFNEKVKRVSWGEIDTLRYDAVSTAENTPSHSVSGGEGVRAEEPIQEEDCGDQNNAAAAHAGAAPRPCSENRLESYKEGCCIRERKGRHDSATSSAHSGLSGLGKVKPVEGGFTRHLASAAAENQLEVEGRRTSALVGLAVVPVVLNTNIIMTAGGRSLSMASDNDSDSGADSDKDNNVDMDHFPGPTGRKSSTGSFAARKDSIKEEEEESEESEKEAVETEKKISSVQERSTESLSDVACSEENDKFETDSAFSQCSFDDGSTSSSTTTWPPRKEETKMSALRRKTSICADSVALSLLTDMEVPGEVAVVPEARRRYTLQLMPVDIEEPKDTPPANTTTTTPTPPPTAVVSEENTSRTVSIPRPSSGEITVSLKPMVKSPTAESLGAERHVSSLSMERHVAMTSVESDGSGGSILMGSKSRSTMSLRGSQSYTKIAIEPWEKFYLVKTVHKQWKHKGPLVMAVLSSKKKIMCAAEVKACLYAARRAGGEHDLMAKASLCHPWRSLFVHSMSLSHLGALLCYGKIADGIGHANVLQMNDAFENIVDFSQKPRNSIVGYGTSSSNPAPVPLPAGGCLALVGKPVKTALSVLCFAEDACISIDKPGSAVPFLLQQPKTRVTMCAGRVEGVDNEVEEGMGYWVLLFTQFNTAADRSFLIAVGILLLEQLIEPVEDSIATSSPVVDAVPQLGTSSTYGSGSGSSLDTPPVRARASNSTYSSGGRGMSDVSSRRSSCELPSLLFSSKDDRSGSAVPGVVVQQYGSSSGKSVSGGGFGGWGGMRSLLARGVLTGVKDSPETVTTNQSVELLKLQALIQQKEKEADAAELNQKLQEAKRMAPKIERDNTSSSLRDPSGATSRSSTVTSASTLHTTSFRIPAASLQTATTVATVSTNAVDVQKTEPSSTSPSSVVSPSKEAVMYADDFEKEEENATKLVVAEDRKESEVRQQTPTVSKITPVPVSPERNSIKISKNSAAATSPPNTSTSISSAENVIDTPKKDVSTNGRLTDRFKVPSDESKSLPATSSNSSTSVPRPTPPASISKRSADSSIDPVTSSSKGPAKVINTNTSNSGTKPNTVDSSSKAVQHNMPLPSPSDTHVSDWGGTGNSTVSGRTDNKSVTGNKIKAPGTILEERSSSPTTIEGS